MAAGRGANFADVFANRETLTTASAVVTGSNVGATIEAGEPRHADKLGGHSVWISWIAPTNGLVTVRTENSTFDTLLAVYLMESGDDPPLQRLRPAAEDDDDELSSSAGLQFGARAGKRYEIAVDGFAGATGDIELRLDLLTVADLLPQVIRTPSDVAVREGDTLILTMDVNREAVSLLEMHWTFNGVELDEAEEPSLIIRNFQPTNAGTYRLRLAVGDTKFSSPPVEVQINSEGLRDVLARNKIEDAQNSGLVPGSSGAALRAKFGGGVTRGYNGSQVFNTTYTTRDPLEPVHCGVAGGPTDWFAYQPPADGTLLLNTDGSSYDTLLAVYTYDEPFASYADLIPVACDDNSGSNGATSKLQLAAESARTYFIVIDGVDGARGTARLNYSLLTSNAPTPVPLITRQPQSHMVAPGNTILLDVAASGATPLRYQWFRNGALLSKQTNATLTLNGSQSSVGTYRVTVSNSAGQAGSADAVISLMTAPAIYAPAGSHVATIALPATRGFQYRVEVAEHLATNGWTLFTNALTDSAGVIWASDSLGAAEKRFYRLQGP